MEIPFGAANREKHFEDIGAALNAGDLTGARRALFGSASDLRSYERESP